MILCDTGLIIAAILPADKHHAASMKALAEIRTAATTTWPCVTEALYILGEVGWHAQEKLIRQLEIGFYALPQPADPDIKRACELIRQYRDVPMDFADASLVVAAEVLGISRIITFDRHFRAYRINGSTRFEILP